MLIELVDTEEGLGALAAAWEDLRAGNEALDVFSRHDWVANWWTHFGRGGGEDAIHLHDGEEILTIPVRDRRLHVAVAKDGGEVVAIAPLVVSSGRWRRLPARFLTPPLNGQAARSDWIAAPGPKGDAAVEAIAAFLAESGGWDVLVLDGLPLDGAALRIAAERFARAARGFAAIPPWGHSQIPVGESWDGFLAARGRHFRKHLWQTERALAKLGEVQAVHRAGGDAAAQGVDEFFDIDRESWKAEHGESVALDARLEAYYRDLAARFARRGMFETWTLTVGGDAVASFLCLCEGKVLYTLKTSFRHKFASAKYSPSMVLMSHIVRDAWARALHIDFVGRTGFSRRWSSEERLFGGLRAYGRGPFALALRGADALRARLRARR